MYFAKVPKAIAPFSCEWSALVFHRNFCLRFSKQNGYTNSLAGFSTKHVNNIFVYLTLKMVKIK